MADSVTSSPVQQQGLPRSKQRASSASGSTPNHWPPALGYDATNPSALTNPNGTIPNFDFLSNWDRGQPTTQPQINAGLGSAIYATPQDLAFAQSTMNMSLPSSNTSAGGMHGDGNNNNNNNNGGLQEYSDPMFWGNMDYNVADIFGSATWENMTGPFAPGGGNMNGGWEM